MAYKKVVLEGDATTSIFTGAALQTSSESFSDSNTVLMTAAAIQDRIQALSTNTSGTVTSVGGTGTVSGLSLSGTVTSSGNLTLGGTLSVATSNLANGAVTNAKLADDAVTAGKIDTGNEVSASTDNYVLAWDNTAGEMRWVAPTTGDITAVTAGSGLTGGATSGAATLNVGAGDCIDVSLTSVSVDLSELPDGTGAIAKTQDELVYLDNGTQKRKLISEIPLSAFDNDSGFGTGSGDITAVTITTDTGSGSKASDTSGSADFTIVGSTGISVTNLSNTISVAVNSTVVKTSGNQSIGGVKTFTGNMTVQGDLTVSGSTITTTTETLEIADNTLVLNSDLSGSSVDTGFVFERGSSGDNRNFHWDESAGKFITNTNSSVALGGTYQADFTNTEVNSSFSNSSTKVPVGHFQWDGSSLYVRTS